jgi:DNA-binding IclR family transcriptional regulator
VRESCHLSVLHGSRLVILAQEESPDKIRLSVQVGGSFDPLRTVSGRLLLSMMEPADLGQALALMHGYKSWSAAAKRSFDDQLRKTRARGYADVYSESVRGVYDLAVLVAGDSVRASLTIACLSKDVSRTRRRLLPELRRAAAEISGAAGLLSA